MTERYPTDANLLALTEDADTGVAYVETGRSPYYLEFRRMLQRLLLATKRANDLRVYQDGDLTVGIRGGRCFVGGAAHHYAGAANQSVTADAVNYVYLDDEGALQINTAGFPSDRTTFLPLAVVTAGPAAIGEVIDRRGEAFLTAPSAGAIGLTATAGEINQALDGIAEAVTAANLNTLCAGPTSHADTLHRHNQFLFDVDGEATFGVVNVSEDAQANAVIRLGLLGLLPDYTHLLVNPSTGFLRQRHLGVTHDLLGSVQVQRAFAGAVAASQTDALVGVVPVSGDVAAVVLSVGDNIVSSNGADGLSATVKVNGAAVCATNPAIVADDGSGFRCTDQGDGTAAVVKSDGTQAVQRGDVLTVDLTRAAAGTVSSEAADAVVLVVIRNHQPE